MKILIRSLCFLTAATLLACSSSAGGLEPSHCPGDRCGLSGFSERGSQRPARCRGASAHADHPGR